MTEEMSRHKVMAEHATHKVTQRGSSVELRVPVEEPDRFAVIQIMAGCDRAEGRCGTRECSKAANVEVDYRDDALVLRLTPKKGVRIDATAMDKCGAWLARASRRLCRGRWPWWRRWPCLLVQKLGLGS